MKGQMELNTNGGKLSLIQMEGGGLTRAFIVRKQSLQATFFSAICLDRNKKKFSKHSLFGTLTPVGEED